MCNTFPDSIFRSCGDIKLGSMDDDWLATFFYEHVLLPYEEFANLQDSDELGNGKDLRAGLDAAIALYHFREQLPSSFAINYKSVLGQCPDYGVVRDIANITKHHTLTRPPSFVKNEKDAISEIVVITAYKDKFGGYKDFAKQVEVRLLDGSHRNLKEILTNVLNFWIRHLRESGLTNVRQEVRLKQRAEPLDRLQCKEEMPKFNAVAGLSTMLTLRLQTYNYEKQIIEVDDLTGSSFEMPLYATDNAPIVDLRLSNEKVGREFTKKVLLTPADVEMVKSLKSETEVQEYVSNLPQVREALGWLSARMREEEFKMQSTQSNLANDSE